MQDISERSAQGGDALCGVVVVFLRAWATSLEVFLRSRFGKQYLGIQAAAAFVLIPLFSGVCSSADTQALMLFLLAYLGALVVQRARTHWQWQSTAQHSRYDGYPLMARFFPWYCERTIKRFIEPSVAMVVAIFCLPLSPGLAAYIFIGAVIMGAFATSGDAWQQARAAQMHDAVLEQEALAERFRTLRGDWS